MHRRSMSLLVCIGAICERRLKKLFKYTMEAEQGRITYADTVRTFTRWRGGSSSIFDVTVERRAPDLTCTYIARSIDM